jgi:hypothetical protein
VYESLEITSMRPSIAHNRQPDMEIDSVSQVTFVQFLDGIARGTSIRDACLEWE